MNEIFLFDLMGMGFKDEKMKFKEIKNGCVVMIVFVGIVV